MPPGRRRKPPEKRGRGEDPPPPASVPGISTERPKKRRTNDFDDRLGTRNGEAGNSKRRRGGDGGGEESGDNEEREDGDDEEEEARPPLVPARLPSYLAEAFGDLYGEDGLLVLGRGLGLLSLIAAFVRFYADAEKGHAALMREGSISSAPAKSPPPPPLPPLRPPLVFVIGLRDAERSALISTLGSWGTPPAIIPTEITNESGQGKDREALYRRGGVFLITSRILIVDLLNGVARPRDIAGMLVGHAEHVTERSTEAFILRIYRTQKQWSAHNRTTSDDPSSSSCGFVKAFTDNPDNLMSGFAKVDKILKALHVRRLYLYPRFHESVAAELDRTPPQVDELHQELTPKMKEIQNAIAAAVQTCIRELKKSTTLIEWADSDLTLENCVTTNFDLSISRQLEHDWHRLQPHTKQLVNDLRTLRALFQYLIQYDCVAFWRLLSSIRTMSAAARNPSMWLLTPAADLLYRRAKERIYTIMSSRPNKRVPEPVRKINIVLEENPKWRLLRRALAEIWAEWNRGGGSQGRMESSAGGATVLVMVKDEKTLHVVRNYLADGGVRTMTLQWLRYLEQFNERSRAITKTKGGTSAISEESRLLLEEEGRVRNFLFGASKILNGKAKRSHETGKLAAIPDWKRKRRKVATEMGRGEHTMQADDLERRAVLDEAIEETENHLASKNPYHTEVVRKSIVKKDPSESSSSEDEEELLFKVRKIDGLRVIIQTLPSTEGDRALLLLEDLKPGFVVLYDAEPSFIRSLEIHAAAISPGIETSKGNSNQTSKRTRFRVFFMLFEASSEEKNFLKAIEREQSAFEKLIYHKKSMPLPVTTMGGSTQEMQQAMGGAGGSYAEGTLPLSVDTRTGKGKQRTGNERRDVAVDVREFRSALPSILHQGGMRLAPVTLTVGDFVLSNIHCVERKSISDLFGSFASGRLYTQAETMTKYYKCPCLLIEFDPAKSFSLQNSNEIGGDIRTDSICSKIVVLTMHFPKLRMLWSRSPHETLKIFKALKTNHEEVDVDRATEVGSNESLDALLGISSNPTEMEDDEVEEVNETARDMLLRLPGINVHNARKVMNGCDTIADIAEMSREQLRVLLGPISGQKLFTFFRQKFTSI